MKKVFISCFLILLFFNTHSQTMEVGIRTSDFHGRAQEKSNWCWAACIQAILGHYRIDVEQSEIVKRTFGENYNGEIPNLGGSVQNISNNLNNWEINIFGTPTHISSVFFPHAPTDDDLIRFLKQKQPIYISYKSSLSTNHAILIISCRYIIESGRCKVIDFTAVDPWPSKDNVRNDGVVNYNYNNFYNLFNYFWIITKRTIGHLQVSNKNLRSCYTPFCEELKKVVNDYGNKFINLRGSEVLENKIYRSTIKFPGEKGSHILIGSKAPTYFVSFYSSYNRDSCEVVYENLLKELAFFDVDVEEQSSKKIRFNKTVFFNIGDDISITVSKKYIANKFSASLTVQSERYADLFE